MHCVDLGDSFPTSVYLQKLASIQPRTIHLIFIILAASRDSIFTERSSPSWLILESFDFRDLPRLLHIRTWGNFLLYASRYMSHLCTHDKYIPVVDIFISDSLLQPSPFFHATADSNTKLQRSVLLTSRRTLTSSPEGYQLWKHWRSRLWTTAKTAVT